jgi:hypothetical protein
MLLLVILDHYRLFHLMLLLEILGYYKLVHLKSLLFISKLFHLKLFLEILSNSNMTIGCSFINVIGGY